MPSNRYLHRRQPASPARSPWGWAFGRVPPAVVAEAEEVHNRIEMPAERRRRVTPAAAFVLLLTGLPPAVEPHGIPQVLPQKAVAAKRAAPQAYWLDNRPAIQSEPHGIPQLLSNRVAGPRRAYPSAYHLVLCPPVQSEPHGIPQLLSNRVAGPRRANPPAYHVVLCPAIPDEPDGIPQLLSNRVAGPRRAGSSAYQLSLQPAIPDEPHGVVQLLPDQAPEPRRTAQGAYWIGLAPAVPEPAIGPLPDSSPQVAQPRPVKRRAAVVAYGRDNRPAVQDEPHGIAQLLPDRAAGPRLAAQGAYWIGLAPAVAELPIGPPTDGVPVLALPFPAKRYAAFTSYLRDNRAAIPEEPTPGANLLPGKASGPRRASAGAYSLTVRPVDEVLPPVALTLIPDRAPTARQTANQAYWIGLQPAVPELDPLPEGVQLLSLPDVTPRRTVSTAYERDNWRAVAELPPVVPGTATGGSLRGSGIIRGGRYPGGLTARKAGDNPRRR